MSTYADMEEDSEVRIAAYLNIIRCADFDELSKIVKILENEKINQVGSFVYSHLSSIQQSECPLKQSLKQLINNFPIAKKFSSDPKKFSQHFEYSKFNEAINIGGAVDASVVFSPKSFVPRSAQMQFTADMFSKSFNMIELGGRSEGLEGFLEQAIGPRTPIGKVLTKELSRSKRATDKEENEDQFDNEVVSTQEKKQVRGSFFIRIFGNEVTFVEYNSQEELMKKLISTVQFVYDFNPSTLMAELVGEGEVNIVENALLWDARDRKSVV